MVPISGLTGVTAIAAGKTYSLALLADGTVRAWGGNGSGQLGDGTTTGRNTPVAVGGLQRGGPDRRAGERQPGAPNAEAGRHPPF